MKKIKYFQNHVNLTKNDCSSVLKKNSTSYLYIYTLNKIIFFCKTEKPFIVQFTHIIENTIEHTIIIITIYVFCVIKLKGCSSFFLTLLQFAFVYHGYKQNINFVLFCSNIVRYFYSTINSTWVQ